MARPQKYKNGYLVNTYHNGKRIRKRFPKDKHSNPRAAAHDFIESLDSNTQEFASVQIDKVVAEYFRSMETTGKKRPSTIKNDLSRINIFIKWLNEQNINHINNLEESLIYKFRDYFLNNAPLYSYKLSKKRLNFNPQSTWNKYLFAISAILKWAYHHHIIESPIIRKVADLQLNPLETFPRWFEDKELHSLFNYFDSTEDIYLMAWFRLLPFTGLRRSEALNLKWTDMNLKDCLVRVEKSKNRKARTVPFDPEELLPYLKRLPQNTLYVFDCGKGSFRMTGTQYYRILQEALDRLNLTRGDLKAFRHSYGTALARAGASALEIKTLMGHNNIKTSEKYLHLAPAHLTHRTNNLPFRSKPLA